MKNGVSEDVVKKIAMDTGEKGLKLAKKCGSTAAELIAEKGDDVNFF